MAKEYLVEGLKGSFPFIADVKNIVVESLPNGNTRTRIPGRFGVCEEINGNNRRYRKLVWEKNFLPGSPLMQAIGENQAFGLLEHPKDGQVDLRSPISHLVIEAKLQKGLDKNNKEIWEVVGEIQILDAPGFPDGQRLKSLIEHTNYCPRVSSRGFGSLLRGADGVDDVQDDYVCEGWDVVIKPSFTSAILSPQRENMTEAAKTAASPSPALVENTPQSIITAAMPPTTSGSPSTVVILQSPPAKVTLETEKGSQAPPPVAPASPVKPIQEAPQEKVMQINEIKSQIAAYRSTEPSKLSPQRFAEGMSQLSGLHQEVANYIAEDAKRSWQGTQLHDEIKQIETAWSETQLEPGKRATKLVESNNKLMRVIKAVAQTGLTFKNKLGESVKQAGRQVALLNEVVERGQAWRQHAKNLESERNMYRRRFMMASEALFQLGGKYKSDLTEVSKRMYAMEFKEKVEAPEIQQLLKEAVKPRMLIPIRLALEGKITVEQAKSVLEGKLSLEAVKAASGSATPTGKVNESQAAAPSATEKKPAGQPAGSPKAPVSEGIAILSPKPSDPREINESIAMVQRLSKATS